MRAVVETEVLDGFRELDLRGLPRRLPGHHDRQSVMYAERYPLVESFEWRAPPIHDHA